MQRCEVHGLLSDVVGGEGGYEVVDGDTHGGRCVQVAEW